MNEKKKLVISILGVILLIIAVVSISYAAFNYSKTGQTINSITTSTIVMNYTEKENGIRLVDAVPMEDANGKVLTGAGNVFDFTVSANISGETTINYAITGSKVEGTTLPDHAVKVWLTSADDAIIELDGVSSLTDDAKKISELRLTSNDASGAPNNQYILKTGVITSSEVTNYRLRMWIASDYQLKEDQVETYKLRVNVYGKEGIPEPKGEPGVEKLLAEFTNDEAIQDYDLEYTKEDSSAKENKMYVFNHEAGTQQSGWSSDELKDYRYIGANPNNYVTFNNEEAGWRIIGIETVDDGTGKREKRIKLIRKDLLPVGTDNYLSWDNKPSGTGSSEDDAGSNDWTDSRLMYLLNPNHESETTGVSGSIYWNRQSGNCPTGRNNATTTCDFSEVGLLPEAQAMIGDAKWYLGGNSTGNGVLTEAYYKFERGETVYQSSSHPRKTNWTGKVGLMYPSDYGYATSGGSSATRATCLAKELYNWRSGEVVSDCYNNDWLFINNKYQWTIAPYSGYSYYVFRVITGGCVDSNSNASLRFGARPVVYLVSNIQLLKGTGAETDPFVFGL